MIQLSDSHWDQIREHFHEENIPDGRRLRRYERRRWFFAWIQWQRRLLVRWEYYAENFIGFVQLASITVLLKQF